MVLTLETKSELLHKSEVLSQIQIHVLHSKKKRTGNISTILHTGMDHRLTKLDTLRISKSNRCKAIITGLVLKVCQSIKQFTLRRIQAHNLTIMYNYILSNSKSCSSKNMIITNHSKHVNKCMNTRCTYCLFHL